LVFGSWGLFLGEFRVWGVRVSNFGSQVEVQGFRLHPEPRTHYCPFPYLLLRVEGLGLWCCFLEIAGFGGLWVWGLGCRGVGLRAWDE
jgi:hypothetical protein